jgi:hypothetical protein
MQKKEEQKAAILQQGLNQQIRLSERAGEVDVSLAKRPKVRSRRSNQLREKSRKRE